LCPAHGGPEVEQVGHVVAMFTGQEVGQPGTGSGPAQFLDLSRQGAVARLAGLNGQGVAPGSELGRGQAVQFVGSGVEVYAPILASCPPR
jgi:hypothetical protein